MQPNVYRYLLAPGISVPQIESLLVSAVTAIEHLHGPAAARLDARFYIDEDGRRCVVDATSPIGVELNKLIAGALADAYGPDSFCVERIGTDRATAAVLPA